MTKIISKNIVLKNYISEGIPKKNDFDIIKIPLNLVKDKDVLVKNLWISVDPYMRARMTDRKNYIPPFKIGKPMEGSAIGQVLESKSKLFNKGDIVSSFLGWRDYYITQDKDLKKISQ